MNSLSAEAQRAHDEAAIRYRDLKARSEKMQRGPYYDATRGLLCIPAYIWDPTISPRANAEWRQRKCRWDPAHREWVIAIPAKYADDQVAKARVIFQRVWGIEQQKGRGEMNRKIKMVECAWCGKKFDANDLNKVWWVGGEAFCSYKCQREEIASIRRAEKDADRVANEEAQ